MKTKAEERFVCRHGRCGLRKFESKALKRWTHLTLPNRTLNPGIALGWQIDRAQAVVTDFCSRVWQIWPSKLGNWRCISNEPRALAVDQFKINRRGWSVRNFGLQDCQVSCWASIRIKCGRTDAKNRLLHCVRIRHCSQKHAIETR